MKSYNGILKRIEGILRQRKAEIRQEVFG